MINLKPHLTTLRLIKSIGWVPQKCPERSGYWQFIYFLHEQFTLITSQMQVYHKKVTRKYCSWLNSLLSWTFRSSCGMWRLVSVLSHSVNIHVRWQVLYSHPTVKLCWVVPWMVPLGHLTWKGTKLHHFFLQTWVQGYPLSDSVT